MVQWIIKSASVTRSVPGQQALRTWRCVLNKTSFKGSSLILPLSSKTSYFPFCFHQANTPHYLTSSRFSSSYRPGQTDKSQSEKFVLIYKFPGINYCRTVSRLKLLQTALTVLFLPPMYYYYLQGQVTYFCVMYSTGTALFAGVMLYCLSFYLRRIIGMMYLNENETVMKVSHLTFWGKRRDIFMPVEDVKALSESGDHKHETILQFKRYSRSDILYFTLKFGIVTDKEKFIRLFGSLK